MTGAGMMDCKKALGQTQMVIWTKQLNGLERMVLLRLLKNLVVLQQKVLLQ